MMTGPSTRASIDDHATHGNRIEKERTCPMMTILSVHIQMLAILTPHAAFLVSL